MDRRCIQLKKVASGQEGSPFLFFGVEKNLLIKFKDQLIKSIFRVRKTEGRTKMRDTGRQEALVVYLTLARAGGESSTSYSEYQFIVEFILKIYLEYKPPTIVKLGYL